MCFCWKYCVHNLGNWFMRMTDLSKFGCRNLQRFIIKLLVYYVATELLKLEPVSLINIDNVNIVTVT